MSARAFTSSCSQRTMGPRMLTWVYHSPSLSAVSETWGCCSIQPSRARPASMLTSTVPSSSTRYHVATDIGWPLGITIAITAGLGSRSSAIAASGSGAFGIEAVPSVIEEYGELGDQRVGGALDHRQHLGEAVCSPVVRVGHLAPGVDRVEVAEQADPVRPSAEAGEVRVVHGEHEVALLRPGVGVLPGAVPGGVVAGLAQGGRRTRIH